MRKSGVEKYQDENDASQEKRVKTDLDGLYELLAGGPLGPTSKRFIYDQARIKAFKGPAGSAKSTALGIDILGRAMLQPGSKHLVSRYDYNDLIGTTAYTMEMALSRLPKGVLLDRDKSPPMRWWIRPAVPGGAPSQIWFMGLKDAMGSWEFNGAAVDEADEVDEKRVHEINTRLRAPGGNYVLNLAFNPPGKDHWLYTACTGRNAMEEHVRDPWMKLFEPEPRENAHNLPPGYYQELAKDLPPDMVARLVNGEWGSSFSGSPVYREFRQGWHTHDNLMKDYDRSSPLFRFWDFGYNRPACIWAQLDWQGRLLSLRELIGHQEEASAFARRAKAVTASEFPHASKLLDFGDPAVRQKKDTGQALAVLAREGILVRYKIRGAGSVKLTLDLVRRLLATTVMGEPLLVFDRRHCPVLIDALKGGYRMTDDGTEPFKDGFYEHVADAFRYGCDNVFGSGTATGGGAGGGNAMQDLPDTLAYGS